MPNFKKEGEDHFHPGLRVSNQFEALSIEAVPFPAGHSLQQRLLLLGAA